jgi:hypothetical protein
MNRAMIFIAADAAAPPCLRHIFAAVSLPLPLMARR